MQANLFAAWCLILAGLLSGSVLGLFFHEEGWQGGYGSWRRRMMRLGHIAFFGTGLLNLAFGLTLPAIGLKSAPVPSACLIAGAVTMPLVCFLSAWRKGLRHLFAVPVAGLILGAAGLLLEGFLLGKGF